MNTARYQTKDADWALDQFPPVCPRCKKHIAALSEARASEIDELRLECVFRCPACRKLFLGSYSRPNYYESEFTLQFSLPSAYVPRVFPHVEKVSVAFDNLFNQSAQAHASGLNEIAGLGYRKALEFVIKDYCVALHPSAASEVRSMFLGQVISKYIEDGKLKRAATLTAWLGNDETHYERRWADKDLTDLIALLELTIAFVTEEVQLENYVRSMKPDEPVRLKFLTSSA